jgi:putative transposase
MTDSSATNGFRSVLFPLAAALKTIYTAPSEDAARAALEGFEASPLGHRFPTVSAAWHRAWTHVVPFFA